jgi:hypothetical protein
VIDEKDLAEINGLIARFYSTPAGQPIRLAERWTIQLRLIELGIRLKHPLKATV